MVETRTLRDQKGTQQGRPDLFGNNCERWKRIVEENRLARESRLLEVLRNMGKKTVLTIEYRPPVTEEKTRSIWEEFISSGQNAGAGMYMGEETYSHTVKRGGYRPAFKRVDARWFKKLTEISRKDCAIQEAVKSGRLDSQVVIQGARLRNKDSQQNEKEIAAWQLVLVIAGRDLYAESTRLAALLELSSAVNNPGADQAKDALRKLRLNVEKITSE
jgi:hypothetical protein